MGKVLIKDVYDAIIAYYKNIDQKKVRKDMRVNEEAVWQAKEFLEKYRELSDEAWSRLYDELTSEPLNIDYAYRIIPQDKEDPLESVRSYLTNHFNYLIQNVFCIDIKSMSSGSSYYIDEVDRPIIQEILLRSVSHNLQDIIIWQWLRGKISDNEYSKILQLSDRLFELIQQVQEADDATKSRWISTLKIVLRSDMAHTMEEAELLLRQIFAESLPFQYMAYDAEGRAVVNLDHMQISQMICDHLNSIAAKVQRETFLPTDRYLEIYGGELLAGNSFPPYELLSMQSICRTLYSVDLNEVWKLLTYLSSPSHTQKQKRSVCKLNLIEDENLIDELLSITDPSSIELSQLRRVCDLLNRRQAIKTAYPHHHNADPYIDHFLSLAWERLVKNERKKEKDRKRKQERNKSKTQKKPKKS